MPTLLSARPPQDPAEERAVRKLATSRHAPGDWIARARMITRSWDGARTSQIAAELHCHPQTVRERIKRFNAEGLDGLGDRPGAGRKPRLTEHERSQLIALVKQPPGSAVRADRMNKCRIRGCSPSQVRVATLVWLERLSVITRMSPAGLAASTSARNRW